VSPKNDIDFLKIFSWESIHVKSSYYEKGKNGSKRENLPFFPTQENNSSEKKNSLPLPIPLNKTSSFSSSLKPRHLKIPL
jgi:hypothetical protein